MESVEYGMTVESAEKELYAALDALEVGNLSFARSSAARAQRAIDEAHRIIRREEFNDSQEQRVLG
jgi:cellobiose-specific phosphotransferase system component IIA